VHEDNYPLNNYELALLLGTNTYYK